MRLLGLLALSLIGCNEYELSGRTDNVGLPLECEIDPYEPRDVVTVDTCETEGGFDPTTEWAGAQGQHSSALPAVGDLDHDGIPEIVVNVGGLFPGGNKLAVYHGDGSGMVWEKDVSLGYGAGPVLADLDADGEVEILGVRGVGSQLPGVGQTDYTIAAWDADGNPLWESKIYTAEDFDYATAVSVSDMDHDGSPEIVAGRVILNSDGTERGVGLYGSGSWGRTKVLGRIISEASVPAVSDIDLDGTEEVIVGNAVYAPDGTAIWVDETQDDGMVAIVNLDTDPEAERIISSFHTVRALDTNGAILWGPLDIPGANIVSVAAIADLDDDGEPEIVVAGGNAIMALNADGSTLWQHDVTDESGATGASIFDFEGDGLLDVVYFDEINVTTFEGATGAVKFFSSAHNSATMMDYPVIADVDADGEAEIVATHDGFGSGFSVYGDLGRTWAHARPVWNQHAYDIGNVNDDLTIPTQRVYGFTDHNTWHSAINPANVLSGYEELAVEILETCEVSCHQGTFYLLARVINHSAADIPAGLPVTLYRWNNGQRTAIETLETTEFIRSGQTGEVLIFAPSAQDVREIARVEVAVDDNGTGAGLYVECDEEDNSDFLQGPFCE